jgi:DNA-directed RNA polymerases I and III subunit RPAC2
MRVKVRDAYTLEIRGESHGLLNILRWTIGEFDENNRIELVGYTIPHPMEDLSILRIQFTNPEDQTGENLLNSLRKGLDSTRKVLSRLEQSLGASTNA